MVLSHVHFFLQLVTIITTFSVTMENVCMGVSVMAKPIAVMTVMNMAVVSMFKQE